MNISRSFNKSRYESFHKTLLYKHIILRGFCSRYLLVFTAWQLLCRLLKIVPEFPIEIPLLSCVQSLGLQRTISPFFLTSVEQGSQIDLGPIILHCFGSMLMQSNKFYVLQFFQLFSAESCSKSLCLPIYEKQKSTFLESTIFKIAIFHK